MNLTYIVLLILLIIYVPFYFYVRTGKLERYGLVKYGPCVMIKTKWGLKMMERLARYQRFWRVFGFISKIITIVLMAFMVFIIVIDIMLIPSMINGPSVGLEYVLAIPGLNPMLPLTYGIIGLVVAMVVHELAHGIQSRANDIGVDSSGLLYAVVPIGAFVEPNAEDTEKASRQAQMDLYSAGISTNLVLAVVLFLVMSFGMLGSLSTDHGDNPAVVGMTSGSPAIDVIPVSAIILDIGGNGIDLDSMNFDPLNIVTITYLTENGVETAELRMGVFIAGVVSGSAASDNDMKGMFIRSITIDGVTTNIGNLEEFTEFMSDTNSEQEITIELVDVNGNIEFKTVTLGDNNGVGFLGVQTNYSGMSFSTPNTILNGAKNPFYGSESITDIGYNALTYIGSPLRGYSPVPENIQWWYSDSDAFWITVTTIYWIFWLNMVLAIFNALPAVPFDGGFLFRGGVDWIADRMRIKGERKERIVNTVSSAVSSLMLLAFVLIVVVMII